MPGEAHSQFLPVVTAKEMARIERIAIDEGHSQEQFMAEAGRKIAKAAWDWIEREKLPRRVALLVGKGNNGGDAYAAGICLLEKGVEVAALSIYPMEKCSHLNQKFAKQFQKMRGEIRHAATVGDLRFETIGLILDGLLGTGFEGTLDGALAVAIERANASGKPILAIDIPSGLDGNSGEVRDTAIVAAETVALGFPKSGFFLRDGWDHVGKIRIESFGLPTKYRPEAVAHVPLTARLLLPPIVRSRHKYQAGYVIGFGGSKQFWGAPKLTGLAALRAGAGIVRVFYRDEIGEIPYELICQKWSAKEWDRQVQRASAAFIGPGIGETKEARAILKKLTIPAVVDADAIQPKIAYPKGAVLTPHRGEVLRLLGLKADASEEDLFARCQKWATRNEHVLILKGAPTWIFSKGRAPVIIPHGDPGMATAGSGDVLTGILAALLAQKMGPFQAAVLGATLHALAGEAAAKELTSFGLIAGDLIAFLPCAIRRLQIMRCEAD